MAFVTTEGLGNDDDKAMPLDLSCKKVSDDEDRDDEVIVTLEIPGRRSHLSHDPIVIPSESDSDSDITVVAVNVKHTKSKKVQKLISTAKLSSDSDSDGDDCILSSYQVPSQRVGIEKKFYDHDSLQSSIMPNDVILDPIVKGKDPFLSDASSSDDLPSVRLMISSADSIAGDDKSASLDFEDNISISQLSMHLGLLGPKSILTPTTTPVNCVSVDGVTDTGLVVDSSDNSGAAKLSSKMGAGNPHSISDLMADTSLAKSADLVTSDCVSSDGLTFGITQLLSSPCKTTSDMTLVKDSKSTIDVSSTVDVSSVFHISSFDRIYSDKQSNADVGKDANNSGDLKRSANTNALPLLGSSDHLKTFRSRLHGLRFKSRTAGGGIATNAGLYRKVKPASQLPHAVDGSVEPSSNSPYKKLHEDWRVISNYKNKVVLRRSDGKMVSQSSFLRKREASSLFGLSTGSVRKKPRVCFPCPPQSHRLASSQSAKSFDDRPPPSPSLVPSIGYDEPKLDTEAESKACFCYGCKVKVIVGHLSFCMAGHGCCGQCLQSQVKTLLARGKKGTLKCRYVGCNSFYLVSQLRNSLPSMVVEILEEKLDREYCDSAARLMMQDVNKVMVEMMGDEDIDSRALDRVAKGAKEEHNLPPGWEPMSQSEEYRLVDVLRGSDEYNYVSGTFHMTMNKPRANIIKIQRVQNTILWEFYMVKKKQMERDNGKPVLEKSLFHGTQRNVVEAICRTNFDWRLCGVHGTMYGQGSYFARDANYSHVYTDQPKGCPTISIHSSNQMIFNPPPSHHQMTSGPSGAATAQIIIQPFPGSSHSVSIAALQSCRFARLPVLNNATHLSHAPPLPPSAAQGSSASTSGPVSAFSFPYWVGNGGVAGPVGSNKVGRSTNEMAAMGLTGPPTAPHIHTMFVARVLVGEYTVGKAGYRKPPPVDSVAPYGRCYDACVNDLSNPTIFVIFNSAQCYPEYIIEYTNKGKDM